MSERDFSTRPGPYALVALLEECAAEAGEARENAVRLARYAAEYLGPLLDAAARAKDTLISAEYHIKNGSWDEMRAHAIQNIEDAFGACVARSVQ